MKYCNYSKEWIENIKQYHNICIFGAGEHGKN